MSSDRKMGHVQDFKVYVGVLMALFVLTVVTWAASTVHFGIWNNVIAVGIAAIKASLVIYFFMHGRYEKQETWAFIYYPMLLMAFLLGGLFLDYATGSSRTNKENYQAKPTSITLIHGEDKSHGEAAPAGNHAAPSGDGHTAPAGDNAAPSGDHAAPANDHATPAEDGGNH